MQDNILKEPTNNFSPKISKNVWIYSIDTSPTYWTEVTLECYMEFSWNLLHSDECYMGWESYIIVKSIKSLNYLKLEEVKLEQLNIKIVQNVPLYSYLHHLYLVLGQTWSRGCKDINLIFQ